MTSLIFSIVFNILAAGAAIASIVRLFSGDSDGWERLMVLSLCLGLTGDSWKIQRLLSKLKKDD